MKRIIAITKNLTANQFLIGSLIMLIGTNLNNFGQLIFHFLAGRMLGPEYYGDVTALINILGIVSIIQLSLGLTVVKFVSSIDENEELKNFCKWIYYWSFWVGLIIAIIFLLMGPFLGDFLKIHQKNAVYILGPAILLFTLANTGRSILQGLLRFNSYVVSLIIEITVKMTLAIPLIMVGYAVFGVMIALLISALAAVIVIRTSLKECLKGKKGKSPDFKPFIKFSIPVFVQGLALTSMYSTDLLLVKHFFPATEAGIYAALAKLGGIVFFGASPITNVMFPLVSKRFAKSEPYMNLFMLSLGFIALTALGVVTLYKISPDLILSLLYGKEYSSGAPLLWWFGVFMGLLAICNLFTQFYLSIGKTKVMLLFAAASLLQIILIYFNHTSLLQVIQLSIISAALLSGSLFVYSFYLQFKK